MHFYFVFITLIFLIGNISLASIKELNGIKSVKPCKELSLGEGFLVNSKATGVTANYILKKTDSKKYQAQIFVKLYLEQLDQAKKNGTITEEDFNSKSKSLSEKILKNYQDCLDSKPSLKSPDGREIQINLVESKKSAYSPSAFITTANNSIHRSNSLKFIKDISCPEIKHEFLHHLGLFDEYKENEYNFDCRVPLKFDNIMAHHKDYKNEYEYEKYETIMIKEKYCICPKEKYTQCKQEMKKMDLRNEHILCPQFFHHSDDKKIEINGTYIHYGQTITNQTQRIIQPVQFLSLNQEPSDIKISLSRLIKSENKITIKSPTALTNEQMDAIIYPECSSKNKDYYTCSKVAYLSSKKGCSPEREKCQKIRGYNNNPVNGNTSTVHNGSDGSEVAR